MFGRTCRGGVFYSQTDSPYRILITAEQILFFSVKRPSPSVGPLLAAESRWSVRPSFRLAVGQHQTRARWLTQRPVRSGPVRSVSWSTADADVIQRLITQSETKPTGMRHHRTLRKTSSCLPFAYLLSGHGQTRVSGRFATRSYLNSMCVGGQFRRFNGQRHCFDFSKQYSTASDICNAYSFALFFRDIGFIIIIVIIVITKTYKAPPTGDQRRRTIQCR